MATAVTEKPLDLESGRESTPVSVDSFEPYEEYMEEAEACIETILAPPLKQTLNEVKVDPVGVLGVQVDRILCQDFTEVNSSPGSPQEMCLVVSFMTNGKVLASTPYSLSLKMPSSKEEARSIADLSSLDASLIERTLSESDVALTVKGKILQKVFAVWVDGNNQNPNAVTFRSLLAVQSGTGESVSDVDVVVYLAETGANKTDEKFLPNTPIAIGDLRIKGNKSQNSMVCDVPLQKPLPTQDYPALKLVNPYYMPKESPKDSLRPTSKGSPPRTTKKKRRGFGLFGSKKKAQQLGRKEKPVQKRTQESAPDESFPQPKPMVNTAYALDETQGAFLRLNVEWKEKKDSTYEEAMGSFSVKLDVQKKDLEAAVDELDLKHEIENPADLSYPAKSLPSVKISVEEGKAMTKCVSFKLDKEEITAPEEIESSSAAIPTGEESLDKNQNAAVHDKEEVAKLNNIPTDCVAEEKKTEDDDTGYFTSAGRDFAQFVEAASSALRGGNAHLKKTGSLSRSRVLHQLETESEPVAALETIRLQSGIEKDAEDSFGSRDVETQVVEETHASNPEEADTQQVEEADVCNPLQKRAVTPSPAELSIEQKLGEVEETPQDEEAADALSPQKRAMTPSPADLSIEQKLGEEVRTPQDEEAVVVADSLPIQKRAVTPSPVDFSIEQKLSWENWESTPKRGHNKAAQRRAGHEFLRSKEQTTLSPTMTSLNEDVSKIVSTTKPDVSVSQVGNLTDDVADIDDVSLASLMEALNDASSNMTPPSRRHDEDEPAIAEGVTNDKQGKVTKDLDYIKPDHISSKTEETEKAKEVELSDGVSQFDTSGKIRAEGNLDQGNDPSLQGKDDETFFSKSTYRKDDEVTVVPSPFDVLEESYNRCGTGKIADFGDAIVEEAKYLMRGESRYREMGHDDTFTFDEPTFDPSLMSGDVKSVDNASRPHSPYSPSPMKDRKNSPKGAAEFPRNGTQTKLESLSEVFTSFVTCGYGASKPKNPPGLIQNSDTTDMDDLTLTTYEMQFEIEQYKERLEEVRKKTESLDDGEQVGEYAGHETPPLFQPPEIEREINALSSF